MRTIYDYTVTLAIVVLAVLATSIYDDVYENRIHNEECRQEIIRRLENLQREDSVAPDLPDYKHLQGISVKVDNGAGCGTGVLFTRDILDKPSYLRVFVWTAAHVVDNLRNDDGSYRDATIKMESRVRGEFINEVCLQAKVIALGDYHSGYDLALLEITEDCGTFPTAEFAGSEILPVGTELAHVGCCHGFEDSVSRGIISQTDRDLFDDGRMFDQTSCPVYPGSSGGGVYTLDGKCVGLVTNGLPGLNFFVPVRRMRAWAKEEDIEWALDRNVPVPLTRDPTRFEERTWPSRKAT